MSETGPTQAIQKANPAAGVSMTKAGVMLQSLDDLLKFAKMCTENGAAPKGMNHQQAAICIQAGLERGLGIMAGLQAGVVVNGVLSWRGWAVIGLIQNSPVVVPGSFKSWAENPGTDQAVGHCVAQRRGYSDLFHRTFSVADAKKAGLWKKDGPWQARPDNMLEWRAVGDMGRFHFGDVLGGIPIAEDVEAGGLGPVEGPRELPADARPAPSVAIKDPILAELAAGSAPEVIELEAMLVEEPLASQAARRTAEPPTSTAIGLAILRERAAAARAEIDKSVGEAFPVGPLPPTEVVQTATGIVMRTPPGFFGTGKAIDPGGPCPRCQTKRNALNGCDTCGWPGAQDLR